MGWTALPQSLIFPKAHPGYEEVRSLLPRHCSAPFNSWVARTSMAARTVQSWFKVRLIPTMDSPIATYSKNLCAATTSNADCLTPRGSYRQRHT